MTVESCNRSIVLREKCTMDGVHAGKGGREEGENPILERGPWKNKYQAQLGRKERDGFLIHGLHYLMD